MIRWGIYRANRWHSLNEVREHGDVVEVQSVYYHDDTLVKAMGLCKLGHAYQFL